MLVYNPRKRLYYELIKSTNHNRLNKRKNKLNHKTLNYMRQFKQDADLFYNVI